MTTAEKENAVADDTSKNEIMKLIGSLSLTECADYYADAEEKNSYGLDGSCAFAVKYKKAVISTDASGNQNSTYLDTVYTVNIGALTDGGYYISPASSNIVYLADEETVNDILSFVDHTSATDESKA